MTCDRLWEKGLILFVLEHLSNISVIHRSSIRLKLPSECTVL